MGAARGPDPNLCAPDPQAYSTVTGKPSSPTRLLKVGAVVLISGAVLLLFGAIGAFYFWKESDSHVSASSLRALCRPELKSSEPRGARDCEARRVFGSSS